MVNLSVETAGLKLRTPFLVGSGQVTSIGGEIKNWAKVMFDNKWGGIVTKTYFRDADFIMKPYLWTSDEFRGIGMQNSAPNPTQDSDEELSALKESVAIAHNYDLKVIGSIMARTVQEWGELSYRISETGIDAIELCLSCPVQSRELREGKTVGTHAGQDPLLAYEIVQEVYKSTNLPIIAKLTPIVNEIHIIARACMKAGSAAIAAINTVPAIIGVDLDKGRLISSDIHGNTFISGISGPIIKPIGLRCVADIALDDDKTPISAVGGINNWQSVVEYFMVGAETVQVCTAVMLEGFQIGAKLYSGLVNFMEEKGYKELSDFRGLALKNITTEPVPCEKVVANIDSDKCNLCLACHYACKDAVVGAISFEKTNKQIKINQEICIGCGLCGVACKQNAISYSYIKI